MLVEKFGWDYFAKLKANGAKIGQGSGQVVDDTASGDFTLCIAVDYIALDKIQKGAHLKMVFPKEMLVIPSPIAIMKTSPNKAAAKKFIDFLLSREGQAIVTASGTLPARSDVPIDTKMGLVSPDEAIKRAIKLDYPHAIKLKEGFVKQFEKTLR
jgi:iron(III) transport system substrate-binding protein